MVSRFSIEKDKTYWDEIAKKYDSFMFGEFGFIYNRVVARLPELIPKDSIVLDAGTGTGIASIACSKKAKSITAIDISLGMLEKAKKKATELNISNIDFQIADLYSLPFKDESFDVVTCFNTFHMIDSPKKALVELKRVLKKDGLFVSGTFCYGEGDTLLKKAANNMFHFLSFLGLNPYTNRFKKKELLDLLSSEFAIEKYENASEKPIFLLVSARKK